MLLPAADHPIKFRPSSFQFRQFIPVHICTIPEYPRTTATASRWKISRITDFVQQNRIGNPLRTSKNLTELGFSLRAFRAEKERDVQYILYDKNIYASLYVHSIRIQPFQYLPHARLLLKTKTEQATNNLHVLPLRSSRHLFTQAQLSESTKILLHSTNLTTRLPGQRSEQNASSNNNNKAARPRTS